MKNIESFEVFHELETSKEAILFPRSTSKADIKTQSKSASVVFKV